jgi:hypothetical protein
VEAAVCVIAHGVREHAYGITPFSSERLENWHVLEQQMSV